MSSLRRPHAVMMFYTDDKRDAPRVPPTPFLLLYHAYVYLFAAAMPPCRARVLRAVHVTCVHAGNSDAAMFSHHADDMPFRWFLIPDNICRRLPRLCKR